MAAFIRPRQGRWPRISFGLGPSSPDRLRPATIAALAELSQTDSLPFYIHLNESPGAAVQGRQHLPAQGGSHVRFLHDCGALSPRTSLAHSVWLTDAELDLIGATGATTALCPVGNLKTRSGVARIGALFERGINVGLGCDNCSCSDAQNMFQAMRMAGGLATLGRPMPGPPYAADVLRAACTGGAKPAGLAGELGALRPGMLADMVLLDLADPVFVPFNSAARQVVYAEAGRAVRTVIVDGRVVRENGRITTINEAALREEITELMVALLHDAAAVSALIEPIRDAILQATRLAWDAQAAADR